MEKVVLKHVSVMQKTQPFPYQWLRDHGYFSVEPKQPFHQKTTGGAHNPWHLSKDQ